MPAAVPVVVPAAFAWNRSPQRLVIPIWLQVLARACQHMPALAVPGAQRERRHHNMCSCLLACLSHASADVEYVGDQGFEEQLLRGPELGGQELALVAADAIEEREGWTPTPVLPQGSPGPQTG